MPDGTEAVVLQPRPLRTVKALAERYKDATTEPALRAQIHDAEDRVAANGQVVKGNGLGPAIIRVVQPGKKRGKVLIDESRYLRWIDTGSAA